MVKTIQLHVNRIKTCSKTFWGIKIGSSSDKKAAMEIDVHRHQGRDRSVKWWKLLFPRKVETIQMSTSYAMRLPRYSKKHCRTIVHRTICLLRLKSPLLNSAPVCNYSDPGHVWYKFECHRKKIKKWPIISPDSKDFLNTIILRYNRKVLNSVLFQRARWYELLTDRLNS